MKKTTLGPTVQLEAIDGGIQHTRDILLSLLGASGELRKIDLAEETPTEGDFPEQGLTRSVSAAEAVIRALNYLDGAAEESAKLGTAWKLGGAA